MLNAAYYEGDALSLLITSNKGVTTFNAIRNGYPPFIDTVERTANESFRSKRHRREYFISDSAVEVLYDQKIIHPSSNWQGQAPWAEREEWIFRRIDTAR
jgi:hypothetical protein